MCIRDRSCAGRRDVRSVPVRWDGPARGDGEEEGLVRTSLIRRVVSLFVACMMLSLVAAPAATAGAATSDNIMQATNSETTRRIRLVRTRPSSSPSPRAGPSHLTGTDRTSLRPAQDWDYAPWRFRPSVRLATFEAQLLVSTGPPGGPGACPEWARGHSAPPDV